MAASPLGLRGLCLMGDVNAPVTMATFGSAGGQYIFLHQVENLRLGSTRGHIRIGTARVATRASMIAHLSSQGLWKHVNRMVVEPTIRGDTFIYFPVQGKPDEILPTVTHQAREYIWVLASTLYRWTRRNPTHAFGLSGDIGLATANSAFIGTSNTHTLSQWSHRGTLIPLELESRYFKIFRERRLGHFLAFRDDPRLTKKWKLSLWRAATLVGRSQMALSLTDAFLSQIFALETLFLSRSDSKSSSLAVRLHGLLGFARAIDPADIERLYSIRCDIVHGGDASRLCPLDLHFADYLAFNALHNAVVQRRLWSNKQEFQIKTSYRGKASRWPKSYRFSVCQKPYRERDYRLPVA